MYVVCYVLAGVAGCRLSMKYIGYFRYWCGCEDVIDHVIVMYLDYEDSMSVGLGTL